MSKRFLVILIGIIIVLGGVFALSQDKNSGSSKEQPTNHVQGAGTKKVVLVEYGDYQCPICGIYYPVIKQIQEKYGDAITFQFRNLPLSQIHQNAFAAARAAEAAGLQNKYWEMHDLLYEGQSSWSSITNPTNFFESYAQQIGLNVSQFRTDFSSAKVNNLVNADMAEFAKTKNEQATPTFFLNGTKLDNAKLSDENSRPDLTKFTAIIDAEIAKQNPTPAQ